ncbi:MAG TPA: AMP-binding protein, partial [Candidatus Thermoplasmatota archaeon]|nr:AMP-binding protein [Candidatus Thermoplasmatota archaeon]
MADWLADAARDAPGNLAVAADDATLTYRELDARAAELAERLAGLGMARGARVATSLGASAEHVALVHALARAQAVWVPLDPRLPAAERDARARLTGARPLALPDLGRAPRAPVEPWSPTGLHALLFTSGTGGQPRAAMLTYENHAASAAQVNTQLGLVPEDRWLASVPLFHVGGLAAVVRCTLARAGLVLQGRFDAARASEALDRGVAFASFVPTMLERVLAHRGARPFPPTLRAIVLGGDAAPARLVEQARHLGATVLPSYGLTEAASMVACASARDDAGSAGKALGTTRVAIEQDDGTPCGAGEIGEITVQGPTVMLGYEADPAATARALRGGRLHTGDLGFLDKDHRLWVVGRADDRITTGGEKVDPAEVEELLRSHPSIADAAVVGLPDAQWGQ